MKFDLTYIDSEGKKQTPVVIHRAILGSLDRFIAYIIEEYKGALPLWLSPVQVNVIPVNNEYHLEYARKIVNLLKDSNIRVNLDERNEKLSYKMRESVIKKIPYTLILGGKEMDSNSISYRKYKSEETVNMSTEEFITKIKEEIKNKSFE